MKKILVIACSILLVLILFTVAFQFFFKPAPFAKKSDEEILKEVIASLDEDNAEWYYLRACLARDESGMDDSLFERFDDVLQNGWSREDPELENYLKRNEAALNLVRKGTEKKSCSMPVDDLRDSISYFSGFRQIARLMKMKAGLLEWRGRHAQAAQTCCDLLRFSADVTDNGLILHALTGIAMEGLAFDGVESLLGALEDEIVCASLLREMIHIETGRAPLREILERSFAHDLKYYEGYKEDFLEYSDFSNRLKVVAFVMNPIKRIHGFFMWGKYLKETEEFGQYVLEVSERPYPETLREPLIERIPENELCRLLFTAIPNIFFSAARTEAVRRATIIKTALHELFLRSKEYPESLDAVALFVPEEMLIDPFSMKRFVYKRTDNGYMFYSFGPDLDDNNGTQMDPAYTPGSEGDMVFEAPGRTASESKS